MTILFMVFFCPSVFFFCQRVSEFFGLNLFIICLRLQQTLLLVLFYIYICLSESSDSLGLSLLSLHQLSEENYVGKWGFFHSAHCIIILTSLLQEDFYCLDDKGTPPLFWWLFAVVTAAVFEHLVGLLVLFAEEVIRMRLFWCWFSILVARNGLFFWVRICREAVAWPPPLCTFLIRSSARKRLPKPTPEMACWSDFFLPSFYY